MRVLLTRKFSVTALTQQLLQLLLINGQSLDSSQKYRTGSISRKVGSAVA